MVGDDAEVLVPLAVADLVEPDLVELIETCRVELATHERTSDAVNGTPGQMQETSHRGERHLPSAPPDEALEVEREARAGRRPWHGFDEHAMTRAIESAHRRAHGHLPLPERDVPPAAFASVVPRARAERALRTAVSRGSLLDVHLEPVFREGDLPYPRALQGEQLVEYRRDAHRPSVVLSCLRKLEVPRRSRCASPSPPISSARSVADAAPLRRSATHSMVRRSVTFPRGCFVRGGAPSRRSPP